MNKVRGAIVVAVAAALLVLLTEGNPYHITTWVIGLGILLPGAIFMTLYVGLVRIRTWAGWNAVVLMGALTLLTGESFIRRISQPVTDEAWEGRDVFLLGVILCVAFAFWERLYHLVEGPTFNWRGLHRRQRSEK
jgi:hypothetical protein